VAPYNLIHAVAERAPARLAVVFDASGVAV
jgi:hypothetical protein